jgi:hypothetical protein
MLLSCFVLSSSEIALSWWAALKTRIDEECRAENSNSFDEGKKMQVMQRLTALYVPEERLPMAVRECCHIQVLEPSTRRIGRKKPTPSTWRKFEESWPWPFQKISGL